MSKIIIKKPSQQELDTLNIKSWNPWSCNVSKFDWEYSEEEVCYLFEGQVVVETATEKVEINAGDLVTFPKGLKCNWDIKKQIRKVYKFN